MKSFNYFNIMKEVKQNVVKIKVSGCFLRNEGEVKTYFLTLDNSEVEEFLENGLKALKDRFYDLGYYVDEVKLIDNYNTYDFSDILE